MPLKILVGDIMEQEADVLVIPANKEPIVGSRSLDAEVFYRAGFDDIREERKRCNVNTCGEVAVTKGYRLKFKHIIHAITPEWKGGGNEEISILEKCYYNSLDAAAELNARSVAFPLLASKSNKFPPTIAALTAYNCITKWLDTNKSFLQVYLVIYSGDEEKANKFMKILNVSPSDKDLNPPISCEEYTHALNKKMKEHLDSINKASGYKLSDSELKGKEDKYREKIRLTYMRKIFNIISSGEMARSDFMKATGVSKEYLSQIIDNYESQRPQIDKAIALAIGLKLNKEERMEFYFSLNRKYPDNKKHKGRDAIIEEMLDSGIYSIDAINQAIEEKYPDLCLVTKSRDNQHKTEEPRSCNPAPKER